jgi:hypothetical protein
MAVVIDKYRWQWEIWSDDAIYLMMMKRIAIIERTMVYSMVRKCLAPPISRPDRLRYRVHEHNKIQRSQILLVFSFIMACHQ